jgi:futalosine hydrolase
MKILVVAATFEEIEQSIRVFEIELQSNKNYFRKQLLNDEIDFLITGVGSYSMLYVLTKHLSFYNYDLVINVGIAGSFDSQLSLSDVVFVESEQIGDLGIETKEGFVSLAKSGLDFLDKDVFLDGRILSTAQEIYMILPEIRRVSGLSVNTVSGTKATIERLKTYFDVQVESMEGAAFSYVCAREGVRFVQMRSISNYVQIRDKEKWQIMAAINNLNMYLKILLFELLKR